MGIIEFFIVVVVVGVLAALAVWALDHLAPGHPPLFTAVIWFVAGLIILMTLARAANVLGLDPQIPRLR